MGAVVEQMQQTYDLQVSGYYSQLQLVKEFLLHERELSLETDMNKSFFEAWEKNRKVHLYSFGKWSGNISRWNKMRIDMPSKFLLDLKNGYNIGKLVRVDYDQKKKKTVIWLRFHVRNILSMGKFIRQLEACMIISKLDSMLKLKGYDGKAYLFILDNDGNITYTNQSGDKYLRNYSC